MNATPSQLTAWPTTERLAWQFVNATLSRADFVSHQPPRLLCSSTGLAQATRDLAEQNRAQVDLFEVEHYRFSKILSLYTPESIQRPDAAFPRHQDEAVIQLNADVSMRLLCQPDPPEEIGYDISLLMLRRDGAAEWGRDMIQRFANALAPTGMLVVIADHPDDHWVGDQLRSYSKSVRRDRLTAEDGGLSATGYAVQRSKMRLKLKDFDDQYAFRDHGRLIHVASRPGVFSHRRLDLGARRLIDAMHLEPGQRVLDIGCGAGVMSLAAALRHPDLHVTAIDSHARAVQTTLASARLNNLEDRIAVHLTADGSVDQPASYDVAIVNPPYYANLTIADLFMESARNALRPGGRLWAVCKQPDWYQINAPRWFDRVTLQEQQGGYWIVSGRCPG